MKGYKAFEKGMVCRGKQYAENAVFEENNAEICKSGMHFCEAPFDVLNHYPLIDDDGNMVEVAEVEALGEVKTDDHKKYCTKKIRIGAKLDFKGFIKAGIDFLIEKTKTETAENYSGYGAQIGSSGDYAKIGSSGDYAQIGSSGYGAQIGSSGDYAQIGSSGNYAKIGSSGYGAQIGSSGNCAQIGSSGNCAQINASGKDSVVAVIGVNGKAKASVGSWITLAEYEEWNGNCYPVKCVKTEYVDGERIKAGTWYVLKDGEFTEVQYE